MVEMAEINISDVSSPRGPGTEHTTCFKNRDIYYEYLHLTDWNWLNSLVTNTPRKKRGKTYCRKGWHLDRDKRISVEFNIKGQPVGRGRAKLASGCGVVARMGNYCSLIYSDWRRISGSAKDDIIKYIKERYVFPDGNPDDSKKYEKYVLRSIGTKWRNYKSSLRKHIYKLADSGSSLAEIVAAVPDGVNDRQWRHLVNEYLSKSGRKASANGKKYRSQQIELHRCGNKSYAEIMHALVKKKKCPVGPIEFYKTTHSTKKGDMDDDCNDVYDKCKSRLDEKMASLGIGVDDPRSIDLEYEVIHEIRGPERPGRVRGEGLGPTPSTIFGSRHATLEVRRLEGQLAIERAEREALLAAERTEREALLAAERAEREALLAAERAEREALLATERAEREALLAVEQAARSKLEADVNQLKEKLELLIERSIARG